MYITNNINFGFLANQNAEEDLTPQVIRVEKEKDRNGNIREVLVLSFPCRVDRELLQKSNCEKIEVRLSKFDTSYYRAKAKLTQTKVAVSKIQSAQKQENATDAIEVDEKIKTKQQKRKDKRKKRISRKEEKRNRRKGKRSKKGIESLFSREKNNSGDRRSRRRGGSKNRDRFQKNNKTPVFIARSTPVKVSPNSKLVLEPKNLLVTAKAGPTFNLIKNQDVYAEAKKMSTINFENNINISTKFFSALRTTSPVRRKTKKESMLEPGKILQIKKLNSTNVPARRKALYGNRINVLRNYQKHYLDLVDKSIDPMQYFQESINKSSFNQQRKGSKSIDNQTGRSLTKQSKSLIQEIKRQIGQISNNRYEFKKVPDQSRYKILHCTGRISLEDLKSLGRKAYVLFIAKDARGINLQSQDYAIQVNEVLRQMIKQSTRTSCSVVRKPSGVAKLLVSNTASNHPLDVDIEVKKLKRQTNFLESFYEEILGSYKIPSRSTLSVVDGTVDANPKRPVNLNACDNLFFRTTLNYRDRKYSNSFAASVKGVNGTKRNDNIPNLNIVARIDEKSRGVNVEITNISSNISAVKLVKYRYKGSSKGKLLETFDLERNINDFVFLNEEQNDDLRKTVSFFDTDVFEQKVYMYTVECIMKNGERKLASDYFIEKFEERSETVLISDVVVNAPSYTLDASNSVNEEREATRSVEIEFKIEKIQTEVDKVLSNLFGNLFEIYKDELKQIKDVQGLVYSIEVQRIEVQTGDAVTVSKVTADADGMCKFVDPSAPAFFDLVYKLVPRVRPANEVISAVVAQTPFLAKRTINQPVNFVSAAARLNSKNRRNKVFTAKKDKFNDRQIFKRGRIRSAKTVLTQNGDDLFADSSTGDITYINVAGLSGERFFDRIVISEGNVEEIKHVHSTVSTINDNQTMPDKYYELSFTTNNDFLVDFYIVFIKEGQRIYSDGVAHSPDVFSNDKDYRYLVKHTGSAGVVEYYVTPILKNGRVLRPTLVTAQLIR